MTELQNRVQILEEQFVVIRAELDALKVLSHADEPPKDILSAICASFEVTPREIISKNRKSKIVDARFAYFAILKEHSCTVMQIGLFSQRDHSTVTQALQRFNERYTNESSYRERVERARSLLVCGL